MGNGTFAVSLPVIPSLQRPSLATPVGRTLLSAALISAVAVVLETNQPKWHQAACYMVGLLRLFLWKKLSA